MTELEAEHLLPRHCWGCWVEQLRSAFSKTQWNKEHSNPVASRTCMKCITAKQEAAWAKSYKTTPRDLRCATNRITDASANKCFGVADISIFDAGAEILFSCHPVHAFHDASQDGIIMLLGLWTLTSSSSGQM
jgi:hypothetical protein